MPINKAASAKGESGFTLIDLLFTASLICTLCTMALPSLMRARGVGAVGLGASATVRVVNSSQLSFAVTCGSGFYSPDFPTLGMRAARQLDGVPAARAVDRHLVPQTGLQLQHDRHGAGRARRATCNGRPAGTRAPGYAVFADPLDPVGNPHFYGSNADGTIYQHNATLAGVDARVRTAERRHARQVSTRESDTVWTSGGGDPCLCDRFRALTIAAALFILAARRRRGPDQGPGRHHAEAALRLQHRRRLPARHLRPVHRVLAEARQGIQPDAGHRDRQDGGRPAASRRDRHRAGELRQAGSLQADLAAAAPGARADRRRRRARSRRKASRSSGSTAACTRPKSSARTS